MSPGVGKVWMLVCPLRCYVIGCVARCVDTLMTFRDIGDEVLQQDRRAGSRWDGVQPDYRDRRRR